MDSLGYVYIKPKVSYSLFTKVVFILLAFGFIILVAVVLGLIPLYLLKSKFALSIIITFSIE